MMMQIENIISQINKRDMIFTVCLIIMIVYVGILQNDNFQKMNEINNLTTNITKLTKVYSFVDDYKEYSSICNTLQQGKVDVIKAQCTQQGWDFANYYVSYPSKDFLVVCMHDGKAEVMRFR